ncbi:competence protein ComEC [Microbacterium sp. AG1240]|uniref:ComEC/Rec2 family competence protein n=1 Tax=Microbacterium sp. AG1240 TaxID=2183992 RepID=UPI000EB5390F|nr:ComEC/Rec2 family competence protein [Microbacterium sp. AG1240]RKT36873.1 competence protein ComEC [Microbacterium sp. AG1240]
MSAARRRRRAARLVPAAAASWAAAALAVCVPQAAVWAAPALWAVAVVGCALLWQHPTPVRAVIAVAVVGAAVGVSHVALAQPGRASVDDLAAGGGRSLVVEATISGKLDPNSAGDIWFDALADRIAAGDRAVTGGVLPLRIGVSADAVASLGRADIGSEVTVRGTSIPVRAGDRAVLVVRAQEVIVRAERPHAVLAAASDLRRGLVESAGALPGPGAALVPGLAVGETRAVSPSLDESMKASSLSHLTAVSGANCALVVGVAYGASALVGARRGARIAAGLVTLGGFIMLVTPEPSVVRAGAMAAIAMFALALGRAGAGLSVLCIAVVLLLAVDPWLAVSLGFALSTVATASLLVLARPLAAGLCRWMPRPLALALSIPLAAQLACGPLLVLVDPRVPVLGVAANLLAAPAAPVATLAGLAACLAAPFPWVQDGLTAIAWLPASWIAAIADVVGSLPGQQLPWWSELGGLAALSGVSVCVAVVVLAPPGTNRRMLRGVAVVVVCAVVGVSGGQTALRTVAGPWTVPGRWAVAACDVGQGDAVLLRSEGAVALIDTGPDPARLETCLARFGISRLDLLVLTHFDADHRGGVEAVRGRVDLVVHGPSGGGAADRLLDGLRRSGARTEIAHPGMQGILGGARWRVLWPSAAVAAGNDASVVLDVRGGGVPDTLLLGDLSAEAQQAMQRNEPLGEFDVVKVAHHGSADQDARLYAAASPTLALITVGADNDYGHPRESILSTLASVGATVARTDQEGIVAVWRGDDGALALWRERDVVGAR